MCERSRCACWCFPERLRAELGKTHRSRHTCCACSQFGWRMQHRAAVPAGGHPPKDLRHLRGLTRRALHSRGLLRSVGWDANLAESLLQECVLKRLRCYPVGSPAVLAGTGCGQQARRSARLKERGRLHRTGSPYRVSQPWPSARTAQPWPVALGWHSQAVETAERALFWRGCHTNRSADLAFSPDGRLLASSGVMRQPVLGCPQRHQPPDPATPGSVIGSAEPRWRLASGDFGMYSVVAGQKTAPGRCVQTIEGHTDRVLGLAFAPDGRTLASGSWDRTVKLWEVVNGRLLQTLSGHRDKVHCVAWSPDGRTVASGSVDKTIWLYDVVKATLKWLVDIAPPCTARPTRQHEFVQRWEAVPCAWGSGPAGSACAYAGLCSPSTRSLGQMAYPVSGAQIRW